MDEEQYFPYRGSTTNPRRRREADQDDDDSNFAYKRPRTAVACNSCKERKSRCSGTRPVCGTCVELGLRCVYRGPPRPPGNPQARELQYLRSRVQAVEQLLHTAGLKGDEARGDDERPHRSRDRAVSPDATSASTTDGPAGQDTVDGMGVITFADESTSGYFGLSSNAAFFGHVSRLLESTAVARSTQRNPPPSLTTFSRPPSPPLPAAPVEPPNSYFLPPREDVLRMVDVFFSVTGSFFPFIHKRSIVNTITESGTNMHGVRRSWLCLLNSIMAMGESLCHGQISRHNRVESDVYFDRALILSPWTLSNTTNLETVQALIVMTLYLQGASRSAQTWRLHGLLVQAALQMGLHTQVKSSKISPLEREIRTRTWYTCFVLDKILSMAYGRPPLIPHIYVRIDLPLDVELDSIQQDGVETWGAPPSISPSTDGSSSCSLFLATIKLYRVQGHIIEELYHSNFVPSADTPPDQVFGSIVKFRHLLGEWKRELQPVVDVVPVEDLDPAFHLREWTYTRSQTVLTIRHLGVVVLLHRRAIEVLLDSMPSPATAPAAIKQRPEHYSLPIASVLVETCTNAAVAIIQITRAVGPRNDMLPAWWFTVYHVFNAALVLFGVVCLSTVGNIPLGSRPLSDIVNFMQIALDDLPVIGRDTRIVRRCSKYLRKIIQISLSLSQNPSSHQGLHRDASFPLPLPPQENVFSVSEGSIHSPWNADFGEFLINDDSNFLDWWADLVPPAPSSRL